LTPRAQITGEHLALYFQPYQKKENSHQAIVDQQVQVHGESTVIKADLNLVLPKMMIPFAAPAAIGYHQGGNGRKKKQHSYRGLISH
jgi:hypothetical protein